VADPVTLPVTRFEQLPGLCGAATAQMILHFKGKAGSSLQQQRDLFEGIKTNTAGRRPRRGCVKLHDCPAFPNQKCARCEGERCFTCWCTYPPALERTLNDHLTEPVVLTTHVDDVEASARALESVDAGLPPAVLVQNGLHWLVVSGYTPEGDEDAGLPIGDRVISEVHVKDPGVSAANQLIAIDTWLDDYVSPVVLCGDFLDLVVVIGAPGERDSLVQTQKPAPPGGGRKRERRR
jgi:hypothetical protein